MNTGNSAVIDESGSITEHATLFRIHPVIMEIIHARGYRTPGSIDSFLNGTLADLHSPLLFEGMRQAVGRIRKAISDCEKIGIFADSDLDGITSLAVLYELFSRMKIAPFLRYLKDDENYGLTMGIIDEFRENGVTLIVTVDSGTRDVAEIAYARSLGIDVIVTDHHEQDNVLPDAILINPKAANSTYPFKNLAGVGVAFKLSHAILMSYLPSYNKLFIIISGSDDTYDVSFIRDCIVEKIMSGIEGDTLRRLVGSAGPEDFILVNDGDTATRLKTAFEEKKIHDYRTFLSNVTGKPLDFIVNKIRTMSDKRSIHLDTIDILNRIFMEAGQSGPEKIRDYIESVLGLVAIGSIADVISLTGENRVLVRAGLENLGRTRHQALSMLMNGEKIDSRFIGWTIAPLLNTPGRIGKTELTVNFFTVTEGNKLREIIAEIKVLNEERRTFVKQFCGKMLEDIDGDNKSGQAGKLIHIKTDHIPEGYAGLIANRIADSTGRPVIVTVFPGKNGIVKGSGRSRSGTPFFSHFGGLSERFVRIGGHENAFGFTIEADKVDEIISQVEQCMEDVPALSNDMEIDCELDIACITAAFINELQKLEPYGNGNREPVFITRAIAFETFQQFGNNHGKYSVSDYNPLLAIGWGMGFKMKELYESGKPLDIIYRLENNFFNGKISPRMIIIDLSVTKM